MIKAILLAILLCLGTTLIGFGWGQTLHGTVFGFGVGLTFVGFLGLCYLSEQAQKNKNN